MKKSIFTAIITAFLVFGISAYAYSLENFSSVETKYVNDFYTIITDIEGDTHKLKGAIDTVWLDENPIKSIVSSYEIFMDGESIIKVEYNSLLPGVSMFNASYPASGGYYSVEFDLSKDDNTSVFLTGLTKDNLENVQTELISATLSDSAFSLEDCDFIDAEKKNIASDGDDMQCWAASAANMLHYTGWGMAAGFSDPDEIFDDFNTNFNDMGSSQFYGLQWFFNGNYLVQGVSGWSAVNNYGNSGGYLKDYYLPMLANNVVIRSDHKNIVSVKNSLKNGYGVGLGIGFLNDAGTRLGGHALTAWGYVCDNDYTESSTSHITAIIVSDSDSDMLNNADRTAAPNKMAVLNMEYYNNFSYDTWNFKGYNSRVTILEDACILKPYSADLAYEEDVNATLDLINDTDFFLSQLNLSVASDISVDKYAFELGDVIYIKPKVLNYSDTTYSGNIKYKINIKNNDDNTTSTYENQVAVSSFKKNSSISFAIGYTPKKSGNYTVTMTINPDKTTEESYFYNNTYSQDFMVLDNPIDTSLIEMSASFGTFANSVSTVTLNYTNTDILSSLTNPQFNLYYSYYQASTGKWTSYTMLSSSGSIPVTCTIPAKGSKAKFKLVIESDEDLIPVMTIDSGEYDLLYTSLSLIASADNTGTYTNLSRDAKSLNGNEKFAFLVSNTSTTETDDNKCDIVVYAVKDGVNTELYRKEDVSVGYGTTSEVISFNSWSASLSGTYTVIATLTSDYGKSSLTLGQISVKEKASYAITTLNDTTNAYDGLISLREAILYRKELGETSPVILAKDTIYRLSSPLIIDHSVLISGSDEGQSIIYGNGEVQLFSVSGNGNLSLDNTILHSGYDSSKGGAIYGENAKISLDTCIIYNCRSDVSGGGIYLSGGSIEIKNSSIRAGASPTGGAITIADGAVLNMLNTTVFSVATSSSVIYNNGGNANVIYSTLVNNTSSTSDTVTIGTNSGTTNVLGSIISLNGLTDVGGGGTKLYGCYYTNADNDVDIDNLSVQGNGRDMFVCGVSGGVYSKKDNNLSVYTIEMSPEIFNGIAIKNNSGYISYSKDNNTWADTNIQSVFESADFALDILGNSHTTLFGACAAAVEDARIVDISGQKASVYLPYKTNAIFIEKTVAQDLRFGGATVHTKEFMPGTNIIELETAPQAGFEYMLWDGIATIKPLCESKTIEG